MSDHSAAAAPDGDHLKRTRAPHVGLLTWLTRLLLALAVLRILLIVLPQPMLGYANQYDMARTSACFGLWPDLPAAAERESASPAAPLRIYRLGLRIDLDLCSLNSPVAVAALGAGAAVAISWIHGDAAQQVDLRFIGAAQAVLFTLSLLLLHHALRAAPTAQLLAAITAAVLIADPFNTLFLNTLYGEFFALWSAWLVFAGVVLLMRNVPPRAMGWLLLPLGLLLLGSSRMQHALLPLAIVLLMGLFPVVRKRLALGHSATLLLAALLPLAFHALKPGDPRTLQLANLANAIPGALLPATADPARMTARLGLPVQCAELVYTNWYMRRGRDLYSECPQLAEVSLVRVAAVIASEPVVALRMFGSGLLQSTAWRLRYVGEVEAADRKRAPSGPLGLRASFTDWTADRGFVFHALLWILPSLVALYRLPHLLRGPPTVNADRTPDLLLQMAVLVAVCGWASALLGDGYSELTRHLHLAQNAIVFAWLLLPALLLRTVATVGTNRPAKPRTAPLLAWTSIVFAGAAMAIWLPSLKLAAGVLDRPAGETLKPGAQRFLGWSIDQPPPQQVEARFASGRIEILPLHREAALSKHFPINQGRAVQRFDRELQLTPEDSGELQIVSIDPDGEASIIDRRWLQIETAAPAAD